MHRKVEPVELAEPVTGGDSRREPMTSRGVWVGTLAITALLLVARSGSMYSDVRVKLDAAGVGAEIQDKALEQLAVNIGFTLAILISLAVLLGFYSIASLMERNIFSVSMRVGRQARIGPFYPVVLASTVPVHIVCLTLDLSSPKDSAYYYLYTVVAGLACPFIFRSSWRNLAPAKVAAYFGCSFGLAVLSMAT
jgi:hypothetical protein